MHAPGVQVEQRAYDAHPEIGMSDHRPVSAGFVVRVRLRAALFAWVPC